MKTLVAQIEQKNWNESLKNVPDWVRNRRLQQWRDLQYMSHSHPCGPWNHLTVLAAEQGGDGNHSGWPFLDMSACFIFATIVRICFFSFPTPALLPAADLRLIWLVADCQSRVLYLFCPSPTVQVRGVFRRLLECLNTWRRCSHFRERGAAGFDWDIVTVCYNEPVFMTTIIQ